MPTEGQCNDKQRDCRKGVYKAIGTLREVAFTAIEKRVSRWAFALILSLAVTVMGVILTFAILRGNGKASQEDFTTVRDRVDDTRERCSALETRQETLCDDVGEIKRDVKAILARLPPK